MNNIDKLVLHLMDLLDESRVEGSIRMSAPPPSPAGEVTPSFLSSAVMAGVGSTLIDFPVINIAPDIPMPQPNPYFHVDEQQIKVTQSANTVTVFPFKYIKQGEEKEFAGAQVTITNKPALVVFNIETEQVEVVIQHRLPHHIVLACVI